MIDSKVHRFSVPTVLHMFSVRDITLVFFFAWMFFFTVRDVWYPQRWGIEGASHMWGIAFTNVNKVSFQGNFQVFFKSTFHRWHSRLISCCSSFWRYTTSLLLSSVSFFIFYYLRSTIFSTLVPHNLTFPRAFSFWMRIFRWEDLSIFHKSGKKRGKIWEREKKM